MTDSNAISRSFYAALGVDGLARRTRPEWDEQIVEALLELLPRGARVLDVGCGYGRVALPLARAGFSVTGLDLSPDLLEAARATAARERLDLPLDEGSMTAMPYEDASFDVALCLWSAFNELLDEDEQVAALAEMHRVLRPGGFALVEGSLYEEPTPGEIESGVRRGPEHRVDWSLVEGLVNPHFRHDARSFSRVCRRAGVHDFEVFERDWATRRRQFLRIRAG